MRLVRFRKEGLDLSGRLRGEEILPLHGQSFSQRYYLSEVTLLPPCTPTKIVAVGLNYHDHAAELNLQVPEEPLLFMKPSSSVIGHKDKIILPRQSKRVDYEAELAIVISEKAKDLKPNQAGKHVLGYTCLNDVTARDLQSKDGQWTRAKGFDTFCPLGPWIETDLDPADLCIELFLNGDLKQVSRTSKLIFTPGYLVEYISRIMTLYPGDVIATGTTAGIGPMKHGDTVQVVIEGIGILENYAENM